VKERGETERMYGKKERQTGREIDIDTVKDSLKK